MIEETKLRYERVRGIPHIRDPGNADSKYTGAWRVFRPVWDMVKCVKCRRCYIFCPDGCIERDTEGYFVANLYYCKGCGICAVECPRKAITIVEEEK